MLFMALILAVVSFIETAFFFYLRRQARKLAAMKIATHANWANSEALFEEASTEREAAVKMYDEAKWLVVQARAGENPPLPH